MLVVIAILLLLILMVLSPGARVIGLIACIMVVFTFLSVMVIPKGKQTATITQIKK